MAEDWIDYRHRLDPVTRRTVLLTLLVTIASACAARRSAARPKEKENCWTMRPTFTIGLLSISTLTRVHSLAS